MVKDLPDGPLMPGNGGRKYQQYGTVYERLMNAADKAGIPKGFVPHSLRHAFASAMLSKGVPITDVAHWLGHRDSAGDLPDLRPPRAVRCGPCYRDAGRGIRGMEQARGEVKILSKDPRPLMRARVLVYGLGGLPVYPHVNVAFFPSEVSSYVVGREPPFRPLVADGAFRDSEYRGYVAR